MYKYIYIYKKPHLLVVFIKATIQDDVVILEDSVWWQAIGVYFIIYCAGFSQL